MTSPPQFGAGQRRRAIELIERVAWGDVDGGIQAMESALRRALELTTDEFAIWEEELEPLEVDGVTNEFSVPVEHLSTRARQAYAARLLRNVALCYGVGTLPSSPGGPVGEADECTLAGLLRGLNDIAFTPLVSEDGGVPDQQL